MIEFRSNEGSITSILGIDILLYLIFSFSLKGKRRRRGFRESKKTTSRIVREIRDGED